LDEKEIYYIDKYDSINNGYNRTKGGIGMLGFRHSKATREFIKSVNIERTHTDEFKEKRSKMSKKLWKDESYRKKMSEVRSGKNNPMYGVRLTGEKNHNYGKHLSTETRRKISETLKGKTNPTLWKSVLQYSLNGVFIKEWASVSEAQEACQTKHISDCAKGKYISTANFIWRYKTSDDIPQKIDVPTKRNSKGLFMPE